MPLLSNREMRVVEPGNAILGLRRMILVVTAAAWLAGASSRHNYRDADRAMFELLIRQVCEG